MTHHQLEKAKAIQNEFKSWLDITKAARASISSIQVFNPGYQKSSHLDVDMAGLVESAYRKIVELEDALEVDYKKALGSLSEFDRE